MGKKCATCEARTHDLQIMRLTRCRLRQGGNLSIELSKDVHVMYQGPITRRVQLITYSEECLEVEKEKYSVPPVRLELTTFRL